MNLILLNTVVDVLVVTRASVKRPTLFLTNDDGLEAPGLVSLIEGLHKTGFPIIVMAPARQQSASGMRISLRHDLKFEDREDLARQIRIPGGPELKMFSLDGTPCDCVIVALDGGIKHWTPDLIPALCISGINNGPNLSVDVMHSGTVSAAREAGLYGLPSIATSLATYDHENYQESVDATIQIIEACVAVLPQESINLLRPSGTLENSDATNIHEEIISAFSHGNLMLNINVPQVWRNGFQTVPLGARWYHNAIDMSDTEHMGVAYEVGAARIVDEDIPNTDCNAVNAGSVAVTPLSCWPNNHPLGLSESLLKSATSAGADGLPNWLS